jgi:phage portal protein BeeE
MFDWLKREPTREPPRERIEPTFGNMSETVDVDSSDLDGMRRLFSTVPTSAGAVVNPRTANRVAAVYACRRLVSGAIATLPLPIYKRTPDGGRELVEHDLWWLLNEQPTPLFTLRRSGSSSCQTC